MTDLDRALATVVERCLAVRPGEDVLVVADAATRHLGDAFRAAAGAAGADAVLTLMDERANDGSEPPPTVAAALAAADVYLAPTSRSLSHTVARKRASEAGARGATLPGVTADMLARLMAVDFDDLTRRSAAVAELLTGADTAYVTCGLGTDLTLELAGREGVADDGDYAARGAFGNLPCGEGFIAPIGGDGTIVASSLAHLGLPPQPVVLTVAGGRLTAVDESPIGRSLFDLLTSHGEPGTNLAELGIGTNDRATLTGNILEDEKILGTTHVAFGASAGIGGTVSVPIHLDVLVADASITIGDTVVLDRGRFVLET